VLGAARIGIKLSALSSQLLRKKRFYFGLQIEEKIYWWARFTLQHCVVG
jgi:hypothetical protein